MKDSNINRRDFLKKTTHLAVGTMSFPYVVAASALGRDGRAAPSERVVMGCIGTGGRGTGNMQGFLSTGQAQVVGLCDVDSRRMKKAQDLLASRYDTRGCPGYKDFRELLERDDIDAVSIATPDHWHALVSVAAAKAGKDIYCEKPLAYSVAEGRAAVAAVRRYNRILQTGSQERSGRARAACEIVLNGRIGRLKAIRTNLPVDGHRCGPQPVMRVPGGFDYDMWLGPAPWAPYTRRRCHGSFRWHRDYSDGELTDRGAHVNDIALWGAGPFLKGPVEIEGQGEFPADGLWNTASAYKIRYSYANGIEWLLISEGPRGIRFEGTEGWIFVHIHGAKLEAEPESVLRSVIGPDEIHLPESPGHHLNFLRSVKSREDPVAPVEAGHKTATFCHIGNIALLLKRKLLWDPDAERFINDQQANRMLGRPMRSPWQL